MTSSRSSRPVEVSLRRIVPLLSRLSFDVRSTSDALDSLRSNLVAPLITPGSPSTMSCVRELARLNRQLWETLGELWVVIGVNQIEFTSSIPKPSTRSISDSPASGGGSRGDSDV